MIAFVVLTVFVVPRLLNQVRWLEKKTFIEFETKFMLFVLLAVALVSEELGVHAATGAFLAGLFLSESTHQGLEIEERLMPIIELLFPVFFFHIGYLVEPSLITWPAVGVALALAAAVYISRLYAFKLFSNPFHGENKYDLVTLFAPCMTITATAAEIGEMTGVLSAPVFTSFLLAGLILTILGPLGLRVQSYLAESA